MRILPSALLAVSVLGFSAIGCAQAQDPDWQLAKHDQSSGDGSPESATKKTAQAITINGTVSDATLAKSAATAEISALNKDGTTTPVTSANVQNGSFTASVNGDQSPTGLFIVAIKNLVGGVTGSSIVDGIIPLAKGVTIDAAIDAVTSFKTGVLQQIASGKVPDIQSYVNVVEAFINAEVLDGIEVLDGGSSDLQNLISLASQAILAGENVITGYLAAAGIDIDLGPLQSLQTGAVTGLDSVIKDGTDIAITAGNVLQVALEKATATAVSPVDEIIASAIGGGGSAFASSLKSNGAPESFAFAASKSAFEMQTAMSTTSIRASFAGSGASPDVVANVNSACDSFMGAVTGALSSADLEQAKTDFTNAILGKNEECPILQLITTVVSDLTACWTNIEGTLQPLEAGLYSAFSSCSSAQILAALCSYDSGAAGLSSQFQGTGTNAAAFSQALRLVQKQVAI